MPYKCKLVPSVNFLIKCIFTKFSFTDFITRIVPGVFVYK